MKFGPFWELFVSFFKRCSKPIPKKVDNVSLLGPAIPAVAVTTTDEISNSPMHTKEFQTLSDTTVQHEEVILMADEDVEEEFVDVPTDVHPIEVSCGTSCHCLLLVCYYC